MNNVQKGPYQPTQQLIREARADRMLIQSKYQGVIFTPDELEAEQLDGRLRWGPVNWKLVDPKKLIASNNETIHKLQQQNANVQAYLNGQ